MTSSSRRGPTTRVVRALSTLSRLSALVLLMAATACAANPHDASQQPLVTIRPATAALPVTIEWQPAGAQLVRVYRGSTAADGYGDNLMWSIAASTKNSIASSAPYGVTPSGATIDVAAKPLVTGETYTAQVTRSDPKGSGDGFTNTSNRYVGTATFTAAQGSASAP